MPEYRRSRRKNLVRLKLVLMIMGDVAMSGFGIVIGNCPIMSRSPEVQTPELRNPGTSRLQLRPSSPIWEFGAGEPRHSQRISQLKFNNFNIDWGRAITGVRLCFLPLRASFYLLAMDSLMQVYVVAASPPRQPLDTCMVGTAFVSATRG